MKTLAEMTIGEAASAMGAEVAPRWGAGPFGPVSTDTRTIAKGDFFLALRGENFDGHKFCARAVAAGAAGIIVSDGACGAGEESVAVLRVADTLRAYGELARSMRRDWGGRVLAISGSVGKTTTRRILAGSLAAHLPTLEPEKNFNNLIGVPQTLLKLTRAHKAAVLELGMNMPGELARLTEIADPDASGLTRIGMTHVGMFKSQDELTEAKLSLFEGTREGRPLVVNAACENSRRAMRYAGRHPMVTFRADGSEAADFAVLEIRAASGGLGHAFDLKTPGGMIRGLELRHFGRHHLEDAACAAAMLSAGGFEPGWIADGLANFRTERYRGEIRRVGEWTFILDCYNAAPDSMRASLESLGGPAGGAEGRLVLVLADMLELGEHSRVAHEALMPGIRALRPAVFMGLGPECSRLAGALAQEGVRAVGFLSRDEMVEALRGALRPGDRVFFKGSHGFALEKAAHALAPDAGLIEAAH